MNERFQFYERGKNGTVFGVKSIYQLIFGQIERITVAAFELYENDTWK